MSYLEGNYNEVSSTTSITPASFGNSTLDFNWSIGAPNVLYMGKSFFRITASIYRANAVISPTIRDGLAFSSDPCGSLFSEAYFQMGGNDVSKLNNFHAQSSALKSRLLNTNQYFKSMGQLPYVKPDMNERILDVSADTSTQTGLTYSENEIYPLYDDANYYTATIQTSNVSGVDKAGLTYDAAATYGLTTANNTLSILQAGGADLPLGMVR